MALPEIVKDIEARVKDTGDTMTGNLMIQKTSWPQFLLSSSIANRYTVDELSESGVYIISNRNYNETNGINGVYLNIKTESESLDTLLTIGRNRNNTYEEFQILHTGNYLTYLNNTYIKKSGDTMAGPLNFANLTWNTLGDDVVFGDRNIAGAFCIEGTNGATQIRFFKYGNTDGNNGSIIYDGFNFIFDHNIYLQNTAPALNIYDQSTTRLFELYTDDNENALILNWKSAGNFTQLGLLAEQYGTNDIVHLYRYVNNAAEEYNVLHSGNFSNYAVPYIMHHQAGADFNTITQSGFHRVQNSNINCPTGADWGQLLVIHGGGDTITQIYGYYNTGDLMTRSGNPSDVGGAGSWTTWKQIWTQGNSVTGAVWNDYAECREADTIEPGYVLVETGDDTLTKSTERLSPFAGVSSDTWGFSQGETDKAKTPIAVAGRVLVYPWQDRNNYKPGDCVCAAPDGKVDIMTREEIIQYPDRIVGTVSSVPTYSTWGGGENADRDPVDVNGRIWIKVK